jgi:hypothetical protein
MRPLPGSHNAKTEPVSQDDKKLMKEIERLEEQNFKMKQLISRVFTYNDMGMSGSISINQDGILKYNSQIMAVLKGGNI